MKKLLPVLVLMSLALATVAFAQKPPPSSCLITSENVARMGMTGECDVAPTACDYITKPACGLCCVLNTLYNITDWVFVFLVAIAALFVVFGAFRYISSGGDPEKTKSGRNYILYAAIGLLIAFLAKAVPGLVKYLSGIGTGTTPTL